MNHESDEHTLQETILLGEMENILRGYINQIRTYQRAINSLNMVLTTTTNPDSTKDQTYELPLNPAGNVIDDAHRLELKTALCINVDILLEKLNGFLPVTDDIVDEVIPDTDEGLVDHETS